MKTPLAIAIAVLGIGLTSLALAGPGHDRGRHFDRIDRGHYFDSRHRLHAPVWRHAAPRFSHRIYGHPGHYPREAYRHRWDRSQYRPDQYFGYHRGYPGPRHSLIHPANSDLIYWMGDIYLLDNPFYGRRY